MIDLRIVVPAGAGWAAAIALLPFPGWMLPAGLALWCLAVVMLAAARATRRPVLIMVGVSAAAMALVVTAAFAGSDSRRPEALRGTHEIVGATIVTTQTVTRASTYFAATLIRAGDTPMSVPVLVFDASPTSPTSPTSPITRIEIGTTMSVSGAVQATAPSDEDSYLVFASGPARFVSPPPWYLSWANALRAGLARDARTLPGTGGELLPGLAIGDTGAVSPALNAAMKTSRLVRT